MDRKLVSLLVLAGGSLLSVLIAMLICVLSRGRAQALGLVDEKTDLLAYRSLHDSLTGLPNRLLAMDRAEQMLVRARRTQLPVVGLYVDIDNLGHINDLFGHGLADQCVRIVADRLSSVIRDSDTVARVDGDEFFVLLEGPMTDPEPLLVAERMLEVVRQAPELVENVGHLSLTVSIGLAQSVRSSPEVLLANAKVAQSVAKSAGKDQCVAFESGMLAAAHDRVALAMDLVDAFAEQQLFLAYQPIIDLHDERPIGVEALLRWRHPERGIVSPAMFIPLAEESGLIVPIGKWVLAEACRQAAAWRGQGHMLGMPVNVSARQLDRDGLIEDVRDALQHSGLEPSALTIEITESALMVDADATAKRLAALKELGVRTAVDDFGTGYSSMAYLRQFPVDQLKIDRSFIQGITGSQRSAALVQTLVRLGKSLELETLAEGIEDREQLEALQDQSCDSGQGFLFARPLEPDAVIAWVEQTRQRNHPGALV